MREISTILFFTGQVSQPNNTQKARRRGHFGSCFLNLTNAVIRLRQFSVFEGVKGKSRRTSLPQANIRVYTAYCKKNGYEFSLTFKAFSSNDQLLRLFHIWFLVFRLLLCIIRRMKRLFYRCIEGLLESKRKQHQLGCCVSQIKVGKNPTFIAS